MYDKFVERLQIKGVKVADVARATNINPTLFSEWKKGKSNPKIDKLQKIADYFGVPLSYFTGGDDSENPPVYLDDETRAAVDMLRKRPEMRILFKASENATKEDILMTADILEKFKKGE